MRYIRHTSSIPYAGTLTRLVSSTLLEGTWTRECFVNTKSRNVDLRNCLRYHVPTGRIERVNDIARRRIDEMVSMILRNDDKMETCQ